VTPGFSTDLAGGTARGEVKPGESDQKETVIALDVKSPKPLGTGTVVTFKFRLGTKAGPGHQIPIRALKRSATTAGGKALDVQGADGLITILEPLEPCFFYMH
jgi:hypothetical protein